MAEYTMTTREICLGVLKNNNIDYSNMSETEIANTAATFIFNDFEYEKITGKTTMETTYYNTFYEELPKQIIRKFYMYEIGSETYGKFKYFLEQKLYEIMPKYNALLRNNYHLYDSDYLNTFYNMSAIETITHKADELVNYKKKTGTIKNVADNKNTLTKTGSERMQMDGNETNTRSGSEKDSSFGTYYTRDTNKVASDGGGEYTGYNKEYFSNTPQDNLSSVENGSYLTTYKKNVTHEAPIDHRSAVYMGTDPDGNNNPVYTLKTYENVKDTREYNGRTNDLSFTNRKDTTDIDKDETQTFNTTDAENINKIDTKQGPEELLKMLEAGIKTRESIRNLFADIIKEVKPLWLLIY